MTVAPIGFDVAVGADEQFIDLRCQAFEEPLDEGAAAVRQQSLVHAAGTGAAAFTLRMLPRLAGRAVYVESPCVPIDALPPNRAPADWWR